MTAVDFLVTDRTVLIAWRPQVVECGRDHAESRFHRVQRRGQVGMALQTHKADLLAREHARIRRSVRLMAGRAALKSHRRVLECERPSLIAVTAEATWLSGRKRLHHPGPETSVRIVAIDAGHGA